MIGDIPDPSTFRDEFPLPAAFIQGVVPVGSLCTLTAQAVTHTPLGTTGMLLLGVTGNASGHFFARYVGLLAILSQLAVVKRSHKSTRASVAPSTLVIFLLLQVSVSSLVVHNS